MRFQRILIYISFVTNLYRLIVGILMGTNCAPLVADLFLKSISNVNRADIIEAFNSSSRYLNDLLGNSCPLG